MRWRNIIEYRRRLTEIQLLSARVEIGPIIPIKCTLNAFIALAHINVILFSLGFCCGKDSISRVYRIGLRKTIHWETVIRSTNFTIRLTPVHCSAFGDDLINRVVLQVFETENGKLRRYPGPDKPYIDLHSPD